MGNNGQQPDSTDISGGQGGPPSLDMNTSDTRLLEKAIKQRWDIPVKYKKSVVDRMVKIVEDDDSSERNAIAASRALVQMEGQNQADEHKTQPDELNVTVSLDGSERQEKLGSVAETLLKRQSATVNGNGSHR